MTIVWKHLLYNYLKVLLLSVLTFIALLVVSRLETIAQFATLGTPLLTITRFTLYQIPFVLPIAIPLSSLLSALLLFNQMSRSGELTALRSVGYSLGQILQPLLFASLLLFSATFYLTSEIATTAHLKTRQMVHDFGSVNPLILLQNARIAKLRGASVSLTPVKSGEEVKDVIVATRAKDQLLLYLTKNLRLENGELKAKTVSLLSRPDGRIAIENQESMRTRASDFAFLLRPKGWKIANDHLNFSLLRARRMHLSQMGGPKMEKNLIKNRSEVVRRFAVSFSALSFTFLGALLGMQISRHESRRGILIAASLSALALVSFFIAHELDHLFWISTLLLTAPHILILIAVWIAFIRLQRGIE